MGLLIRGCTVRWVAIVLFACASGLVGQSLQQTSTQRLDLPASGTLRLVKSIGELTIDAWDEPFIEITTIKSVKVKGDKPPGEDAKALDRITVTAERKGNDVIVATAFPTHFVLARPFAGLSDFELEYRIKAPRTAGLEIDHRIGEVHINGITGSVHATDGMGQITLQLAPGSEYSIDSRSKLGAIDSDVPGKEKKRLKYGHTFASSSSTGAKNLFLRVGFGDITILETPVPVAN